MPSFAPTIIILLGATGDLTKRKIFPALAHLLQKNLLPPKIAIIGFSRRPLTDKEFEKHGDESLASFARKKLPRGIKKQFLSSLSYTQGNFQNKDDFDTLAKNLALIDTKWGVCTNKLFYLAVPPEFYKTIFENLAMAKLTKPCGDPNWTRVIVEKPFGKDLKTAQEIDRVLGTVFKEEQIYRIDHYLGKEVVQNILAFRFSNNLFEKIWDRHSIEHIEVKLNETIGVEQRGAFYDGLGAFRDIGQNHLLQMLALVTMEHPGNFTSASIREKRLEALENITPPRDSAMRESTLRAQYKGYRDIKGVRPMSMTETYFIIKTTARSGRFEGIPITIEGGKRLKKEEKEIAITFRHEDSCLCPRGGSHYKNIIFFRVGRPEGITIRFFAKKIGPGMEIEPREFHFNFHESNDDASKEHVGEYERLLLDGIRGDQTLFVGTKEVAAMWNFVDPIMRAWENDLVPLRAYNTGESARDIAGKMYDQKE